MHSQESEDVEKVGNGSSLTDETEEQQSEDLAIIGPNGAPIIASQVPGMFFIELNTRRITYAFQLCLDRHFCPQFAPFKKFFYF